MTRDIARKKLRWGAYDGDGIRYSCTGCGGLHATEPSEGFQMALETGCRAVGETSRAIYQEFGIGDPNGRWKTLEEQALFKFTNAAGREALSSYGVVASWNEATHSWYWAWDFPAGWVHANVLAVAEKARDVGHEQGWQALTERLLAVDLQEAWHLTELAAHFSGMPLVYRAKVNDKNWHFFALSRPSWSN